MIWTIQENKYLKQEVIGGVNEAHQKIEQQKVAIQQFKGDCAHK